MSLSGTEGVRINMKTMSWSSMSLANHEIAVIRARAAALEKRCWLREPAALVSPSRYFDAIRHSDEALAQSQVEQKF